MTAVVEQQDLYPSRYQDRPQIHKRQDPVVYQQGTPPAPLTRDHVADFERDGFISLPSLFSDQEVESLHEELARLSSDPDILKSDATITEPESGAVRSIFDIVRVSAVYDRLSRDPRLLNVVQFLLGDRAYIHQSRVNFKPGFRGKEFYWHSDFETWHVEDGMPRMRCISASIAMTENCEFNGPLMLIPQSHWYFVSCVGKTPQDNHRRSLKRQEYGVPDDDTLADLTDRHGIRAPKGPAGSVTFFECNTLHGSNGNISPFPRSNAFVVYNAVSNALTTPFSGQAPRPPHLANRNDFTPLEPLPGSESR